MVTIYPSLRVAANGAAALVDAVDQGFKVVAIPDLTVRDAGTYENVVDVALSDFGEALGILKVTGEFVVLRDGRQQLHDLPRGRDRIRAFAISDAGDRLALILGAEVDGGDGALEVWSLPAGNGPLATTALPAIERGTVTGNPRFSRISVVATTSGGGPDFRAVYSVPGDDSVTLTPLWTEGGAPLPGTAVALSDEWAWLARADGLAGWRNGSTTPVLLPGTAFERLVYSPAGDHLLAARVERLAGVTGAEMLFRLFDLTTLTEVARATHDLEHESEAHPVVSPKLELLIVRATRAGEVEIQDYDLARSG